MRLISLSLTTMVFAAAAAACAYYLAHARPAAVEPDPLHWMTKDMLDAAQKETNTVAPGFSAQSTEGVRIDLAGLIASGPVYLVFIKDNCPCSILAQPFFQRLYDAFGGKVAFIGITDGTLDQGKEWKAHFQMTFPLVSDPDKKLMHLFHAKGSAYSELIDTGGKIVKLWPGYNQSTLTNIDATIAKTADLPVPDLRVDDAPTKPTSGCTF